jgi:purine-binding chemotaxis protein CheW
MTISELTQLVVFRLDAQRYALPLDAVERIVRAVEVTALPSAPAIVSGVIDVEGRVLPVVDLRRRFGMPLRELSPAHQFVIARAARRTVVLPVDEALGLTEVRASEMTPPAEIAAGLAQIQGVVRLEDGLALIHDLESVLSLDEAHVLDEALGEEAVYAT